MREATYCSSSAGTNHLKACWQAHMVLLGDAMQDQPSHVLFMKWCILCREV